jgi:uncharacterized CHY-type Zn-finger protein
MGSPRVRAAFIILFSILFASAAFAQACIECHKKVTPQIVSDWQLSKHSKNKIDCPECHGNEHKTSKDVDVCVELDI